MSGHSVFHMDGPEQRMSPTFRAIFLTVVLLTIAAAAVAFWTAFFGGGIDDMPKQQVFDTMNSAVKLGLGAILGLIGGQARHPGPATVVLGDKSAEPDEPGHPDPK